MRRCWTFGALAFLSCTILNPAALYAHHNQFQGFDPEREQVVTGTVERFAWQNPHAYIYLIHAPTGLGPDTIRRDQSTDG
jgi:Family of unknown function (DUF6152)